MSQVHVVKSTRPASPSSGTARSKKGAVLDQALHALGVTGSTRRRLKPRSSYPTLSIVALRSSRWHKLAWIFGFDR